MRLLCHAEEKGCGGRRGTPGDLACGCDGGGGEEVVHGAGAVAGGVEGDVGEAEGFEGGGDAVEGAEGEGAGEVLAGDLDAGEVAVVADADLPEAEGVEGGFGLLDLQETLGCDGEAVGDAGREAGGGGFVGEGEAGFAGELADLGFGEAGGDEGCEGAVLGGGALAGAELGDIRGAVVEVHAEGEVGEVSGGAEALHDGEELVLAVEAALAVVALVVGVLELVGVEDLGRDGVVGGEAEGGGELGAGERGGVGDDGEHLGAEGLVGGKGKEGGVGSAGVGDEDGAEVAEGAVEEVAFGLEVHRCDCMTLGTASEGACVRGYGDAAGCIALESGGRIGRGV